METFYTRLKNLREETGLSQTDLGKALGFTQTTIAKWEKGTRSPDNETLINISRFFKVTTDYLLGLED